MKEKIVKQYIFITFILATATLCLNPIAFPQIYSSGKNDTKPTFEQETIKSKSLELNNPQAQIVSNKGDIVITRDNETIESYIGMEIVEGDKITIGSKSYMEIGCGENFDNTIKLDESSTVEVESITKTQTNFKLEKGRVFSIIDNLPSGGEFNVRTPTAVAGVRGTEFEVEYINDETVIATHKGEVSAWNIDKKGNLTNMLKVGKNQQTKVQKFKKPDAPSEIAQSKSQRFNQFRDNRNQRLDSFKKSYPLIEKQRQQKNNQIKNIDPNNAIKDKVENKVKKIRHPETNDKPKGKNIRKDIKHSSNEPNQKSKPNNIPNQKPKLNNEPKTNTPHVNIKNKINDIKKSNPQAKTFKPAHSPPSKK